MEAFAAGSGAVLGSQRLGCRRFGSALGGWWLLSFKSWPGTCGTSCAC